MSAREPRLRIRLAVGIVYDVRLDHLLQIEACHSGRAPVYAGTTFVCELIERSEEGVERVILTRTYSRADFPLADRADFPLADE